MLMYQVDPSKLLLLADLSLLFVFFFSVFSFAYYVVHEANVMLSWPSELHPIGFKAFSHWLSHWINKFMTAIYAA